MPKLILTALIVIAVGMTSATKVSGSIWTASGDNPHTGGTGEDDVVSAKIEVIFDTTLKKMSVILTNTTVGGTLRRGDVFTGVILDFNPESYGAISFDATVNPNPYLYGGSHAWYLDDGGTTSGQGHSADDRWKINDSLDFGGQWTDNLDGTAGGAYGDFGIATTGANGLFSGTGIGGASDYGIVGPSTFVDDTGGNGDSSFEGSFNDSTSPLAQNSLRFEFTYTGTIDKPDDIIVGGVAIFGTGSDGLLELTGDGFGGDGDPVPEPATIAIWSLIGLGGIGGAAWRRRRRKAA